jgi:hypothetical protein
VGLRAAVLIHSTLHLNGNTMKIAHARTWLLAVAALLSTVFAHAGPRDGWWWNAAEAGRGFFLERQGTNMFMAGYFYAADGRATWLVSNDAMPNPDAYDGRLLAFANGQSLAGAYRPPGPAADAGAISVRFIDDTHATLTWPGGTVPIVRQPFQHGGAPSLQPRTGWWWNPSESGRGFSMELQGDHMFIGAYMYDASGNPVWYVADALMQSPSSFTGPLLQFAGGQTLGGTYRAPGAPASVGSLTLQFTSSEQALVTLSDDAFPSFKAFKTFTIEPQYMLPGRQPAAKSWVGSYMWERVTRLGTLHDLLKVDARLVTWEQPSGYDEIYPAFYKIASGSADMLLQMTDPRCFMHGTATVDLSGGLLIVNADLTYTAEFVKEVPLDVTLSCLNISGGTTVINMVLEQSIDFDFGGTLIAGKMLGTSVESGSPNSTFSSSWDFAPRF